MNTTNRCNTHLGYSTGQHKTGWLPFGSGIGDHRIGFIDIKMKTFIGKETNEIATHKARRLQTSHIQAMEKYTTQVEKEYKNITL